MKFKKMIKTIGLLLVIFGGYSNANAAIQTLGTFSGGLTSGTSNDLGNLTAGNTYSFSGVISTQGLFQQLYDFSLSNFVSAEIGVSQVSLSTIINGDSLTYSLIKDNNQIFGVNNVFSNLTSGLYQLKVNGNSTGIYGSAYSVTMNVAAVPEPEEWAMLLAGLGLVVLKISRTRREVHASKLGVFA